MSNLLDEVIPGFLHVRFGFTLLLKDNISSHSRQWLDAFTFIPNIVLKSMLLVFCFSFDPCFYMFLLVLKIELDVSCSFMLGLGNIHWHLKSDAEVISPLSLASYFRLARASYLLLNPDSLMKNILNQIYLLIQELLHHRMLER